MTSLRGHERQEFPATVKRAAFRRCCGDKGHPHCEGCGKELRSGEIIYEHVQPDGLGGAPTADNCKVFGLRCCATPKTKDDNARMAKADAVLRANYGLDPAPRQKLRSAGFRKSRPQRSATRPLRPRVAPDVDPSEPTAQNGLVAGSNLGIAEVTS